ncbi:ash family protein [Glaesserella parasuis]|uniref:ash family protein n=1 Tax=Glaesserella parasuis TaxID=738 RepID=UPI0024369492|nr:ash family protein [Glaesserella parasuis]MDG6300687.1 ash family protein [Glaesserella parasuis]MDG6376086.1 ash family protein [Glaesserella parasuis]MDP0025786.1 ash family protein [Glaesserella parasuis]MDP0242237.1 ash family protein [Glaesserella parasuis]MDP0354805.1 ash family protein [Glaesserella parasuis]
MKNSVFFQKQKQSSVISAKMQEISRLLLTTQNHSPYAIHAFAKSEAERGNSNKRKANNSTPLTRAFFIRCTRTPKENALGVLLSMVACSGQGLTLGCLPYVTVFHPVTRYRPITVESEAIAPKNQRKELSAMKRFAFTYVCVLRNTDTYTTQTVRLIANSETEARLQLPADYRLELDRPIAKIRLNPTACDQTKGGIYA